MSNLLSDGVDPVYKPYTKSRETLPKFGSLRKKPNYLELVDPESNTCICVIGRFLLLTMSLNNFNASNS